MRTLAPVLRTFGQTSAGSQPDAPTWGGELSLGENSGEIVVPVVVAEGARVYAFYRVGEEEWSDASLDFSTAATGDITITGLDLGYSYEVDILAKVAGVFSLSPGPKSIKLEGSSEAATDNIPIAKRAMKQTAVYWPISAPDEYGKPAYGDAAEIDCRWEDTQEEFIAPDGTRQLSMAKLIVDRDLGIGGVLFLGELEDVGDVDDPKSNEGAWEIRGIKKTPNLKGTKYLREVYL